MAVSEIIKIRLTAISTHKDKILELLHKLKVLQFIATTEDATISNSNDEYDLAQVKFALSYLKKNNKIKIPFKKKLQGNKISLNKEEFKKITAKFDRNEITKQITDLNESLNNSLNNIPKYQADIKNLSFWKKLDTIPQKIVASTFTEMRAGVIDSNNYDILIERLAKFSDKTEISVVDEVEKSKYLLIIWQKSIDNKVRKILNDLSWENTVFCVTDKLPVEAIKILEEKIEVENRNIVKTKEKIKTFSKHIENLRIIEDYLNWEVEKQKAAVNFTGTNNAFSVLAWIEKSNVKILENELEKITSEFVIDEEKILEDEKIPVTIKNSNLFAPFEAVTDIYGMPMPDEPDPTPYLAGFFIIFFGMCLTDAGYGLVLALIAFLAIKLLKMPKENSKLFVIMIWGGISTFILGALFGGWFGIIIDTQLPESIASVLLKIRLIDPISNPIQVLYISLGMGMVQLMFGIGIAMYWKIKHGKLWEGIVEDGVWLFILLSLSAWIITSSSIATYLLFAGLGAYVLTCNIFDKNHNVLSNIVFGVIKLKAVIALYNKASGYFSVILSYSRLLALGLATGIMAMVFNMIAMIAKDMVPYLGWVIAILIIVVGHTFNLAINVLGAFIHSARLQFVEFFGQFMEGGGVRFKPFAREYKNIEIKE